MSGHCMTKVNESHILLTGGYGTGSGSGSELISASASSYLYSEETGFFKIENMKTPRNDHGCSLINDKVVFVAGGVSFIDYKNHKVGKGKETEYLNLATLTWSTGPELPIAPGMACK